MCISENGHTLFLNRSSSQRPSITIVIILEQYGKYIIERSGLSFFFINYNTNQSVPELRSDSEKTTPRFGVFPSSRVLCVLERCP